MESGDNQWKPLQQSLRASVANHQRRSVLPLNQPVTSAVQPPNPSHETLQIVEAMRAVNGSVLSIDTVLVPLSCPTWPPTSNKPPAITFSRRVQWPRSSLGFRRLSKRCAP